MLPNTTALFTLAPKLCARLSWASRSLAVLGICMLAGALPVACKNAPSSAEHGAEDTPTATAPDAAATSPAAANAADTAASLPTEDLGFQDALRLLQSGAAYLALEAAVGPADPRAAKARRPLAQAIGIADSDDPAFVKELARAMRTELVPYKHGTLRSTMESLDAALTALLGESSPGQMASDVLEMRQAAPPVALVGTLLELSLGLRAWSSGVGTEGTPAWAFAAPLVCPAATWHRDETVFAAATSGTVPAGIDLLAQLQSCYATCPGVSNAASPVELAEALAACPDVPMPQGELSAGDLESPVSVLDALAVGALLAARKRASASDWVADEGTRSATLAAVDERLAGVTLPLDWIVTGAETPSYPYLGPEVSRTTYILAIGGQARFGMWPFRVVKDGKLAHSPLQAHQDSPLVPVELAVPSALRRTIRAKLQPDVGIVAGREATFAELREAMRATRAVGLERRFLVVVDHNGERRWLSLDSNPSATADLLIQQGAGALTVWISPGKVTRSALEGVASDGNTGALPGRIISIKVPGTLAEALPALHDALASEPAVGRVLVDLEDAATVGDLAAMLNLVDFPRTPGAAELASLSAAEPAAGAAAERRLGIVLVAEHRAAGLGGLAPAAATPREGVTLPGPEEIVVTGPVVVADVVGLLAGLAQPLRNCYERELVGSPTLAGSVVVQLTLDAEGKVTAVSTVENTSGSELLQACLEDGVELLSFSLPEGNAELAVVKLPVRFDPPREGP